MFPSVSMHVDLAAGTAKGEGNDRLAGVHCLELRGGGNVVMGSATGDYIKANGYKRSGRNVVHAGAGDDMVAASGVVYGGAGNDRLSGSHAPDRLYGGPGNDVIEGYGGDDRLDGGPGRDYVIKGYANGD